MRSASFIPLLNVKLLYTGIISIYTTVRTIVRPIIFSAVKSLKRKSDKNAFFKILISLVFVANLHWRAVAYKHFLLNRTFCVKSVQKLHTFGYIKNEAAPKVKNY